jgi:hypothetical protein
MRDFAWINYFIDVAQGAALFFLSTKINMRIHLLLQSLLSRIGFVFLGMDFQTQIALCLPHLVAMAGLLSFDNPITLASTQ